VGGSWGSIVEVDAPSGTSSAIGQLPGRLQDVRLEPGGENKLVAWSQESHQLALLDISEGNSRFVSLPTHPWVGPAVGPLVAFADGRIAIAPLGDQPTVHTPRPWKDVPLIWVLGPRGGDVIRIGRIRDAGGEYLSVALAQVRLGKVGDTLLVLQLAEGVLQRVPLSADAESEHSATAITLPQYMRSPEISEDVWHARWLLNSAQPRVYYVPQFADATFAPDGRLFGIRNGGARWNTTDNPLAEQIYRRAGGWEITQQWLEVYDDNGNLLRTLSIPDSGVKRLVADGMGRLFIWNNDGSITVFRDPTQNGPCSSRGPDIAVSHVDTPDGMRVLEGSW
jgi:hypothetical protein